MKVRKERVVDAIFIACAIAAVVVYVVGGSILVYVAYHFITKYW